MDVVNTTIKQQSIASLWATARSERTARRAGESTRRRLVSELADYRTTADRNDLNALLDTYPDAEVAEIRDILNRTAA